MPAIFSGRTAAAFFKIPGEMCQATKPAQAGDFIDLQSFIAQQVFCFFKPHLKQIVLGGCGEELAIVVIKLTLLQVGISTEAFQVPIFLAVGQHA